MTKEYEEYLDNLDDLHILKDIAMEFQELINKDKIADKKRDKIINLLEDVLKEIKCE